MTPVDARVAKLAADLRRDWELVQAHHAKARTVDPGDGDPHAALVALSLDHAYQAFETLLVRLERALGLPERSGSSWHIELLADCGRAIPGLRPAVYPPDAEEDWEALLRFRHFLRHAYVLRLDPAKLRTNLERLGRAVAASNGPVEAAILALEETASP